MYTLFAFVYVFVFRSSLSDRVCFVLRSSPPPVPSSPRQAYLVLPWNCVKMVSMVFTMMGLLWFIVFTSPIEWFDIFTHRV